MKSLLLLLSLLFMFGCTDNNENISIKVKYPTFDKTFKDSAEQMTVTTVVEQFWNTSTNRASMQLESKTTSFADGNLKLPTISELDAEKVQIIMELKESDNIIARGISSVIDISDPEKDYTVFITPLDKFVELTTSELNPAKLDGLIGATSTVLPDGKVLIWGGMINNTPVSSVYVYSPDTATIKSLNFSTVARAYHAATIYYNNSEKRTDARVLITGGIGASGEYLKSAVIFNPKTETIENATDMPEGRAYHSAVTGESFTYIIGGKNESNYISSILTFNSYSKSFGEVASLEVPVANTSAAFIGNQQIIIAGGNDDDTVYGDIYSLSWSDGMELVNTGRKITPRSKLKVLFDGTTLFYIAGYSEVSSGVLQTPLASIDKYDPILGNSVSKNLATNMSATGDVTASFSVNNQVMVMGGEYNGSPSNRSDLINLKTGDKTPITMNKTRKGATSVLTKTGQVIIIGGEGSTSPIEIISSSY